VLLAERLQVVLSSQSLLPQETDLCKPWSRGGGAVDIT
jgi:hypothetical protein